MEKGAGASLRLFSCENEGTGMRSRTEAFGFSKVKDKRERGKNVLRKKSWLRPSEKKRNFAIKKNAPAQEGGGARRQQRMEIGKGKKIGKGRKAAVCTPVRGDRGSYAWRGDRERYAGREP